MSSRAEASSKNKISGCRIEEEHLCTSFPKPPTQQVALINTPQCNIYTHKNNIMNWAEINRLKRYN